MPSDDTSRRGALKVLAAFGGAVCVGVVAVPGAQMLAAPAAGGGGGARWVKTVRLDSLPDGAPKRVSIVSDRRDAFTLEKAVELGAVWLLRRGDAVQCWSTTCPHLGCSIGLAGAQFNCPCHDSDFALDGKRLSGPSPRDLDALATKLDEGYVLVDFQRFRQGIPDKVQIG